MGQPSSPAGSSRTSRRSGCATCATSERAGRGGRADRRVAAADVRPDVRKFTTSVGAVSDDADHPGRRRLIGFDERHMVNRPSDRQLSRAYTFVADWWHAGANRFTPYRRAIERPSALPDFRAYQAEYSSVLPPDRPDCLHALLRWCGGAWSQLEVALGVGRGRRLVGFGPIVHGHSRLCERTHGHERVRNQTRRTTGHLPDCRGPHEQEYIDKLRSRPHGG